MERKRDKPHGLGQVAFARATRRMPATHSAVDLLPEEDPLIGTPSGKGRAATGKPSWESSFFSRRKFSKLSG